MPDGNDEELCLCIANGLPPSMHKQGERCPHLDMLMFGNAYGIRQDDGSVKWIDPVPMVILRQTGE